MRIMKRSIETKRFREILDFGIIDETVQKTTTTSTQFI